MNTAMDPSKEATKSRIREQLRQRSPTLILFFVVALAAGGLYVWSSLLRSVRYEVAIEPPELYTGISDTAHISAAGLNRWGGRVPFSQKTIKVEIVEGAELGHLEEDTEIGTVRFISNAMAEGQVVLRVFVEDWPFPMFATINISTPIAAVLSFQRSLV
ncbi:MAG: hypothetical protein WBQ23_02875 [Bacteroidota bacterium]